MIYKVIGNPNIRSGGIYYNDGMEIELEPIHAEPLIKAGMLEEITESKPEIKIEYTEEPERVVIPVIYEDDLPTAIATGPKLKKPKKQNKK
jgi:hypothetical protein